MTPQRALRHLACLGLLLLGLILSGCFLPQPAPIARFTLTPSEGESPLVVIFDATASSSPDGIIVRYDWDFGDGAQGIGRTPVHTYSVASEQTFEVRLTVTDQADRQATVTASVTVIPKAAEPTADHIEFVWPFHYDATGDDAANLNDEYFALQNRGDAAVDLSGWSVANERGWTFVFPAGFTLPPGAVVYVHSGAGSNSDTILYWHAAEPVWNNTSDIAILRNAAGLIVEVYPYVSC